MKDGLKGRLCVLLFFALLMALILNWALPKKYSEAKLMSPDFQRNFILRNLGWQERTVSADNLIIVGAEKVDNAFLIGYALVNGSRPWSSQSCQYGVAEFRGDNGGYIFVWRHSGQTLDIPELAVYDLSTDSATGQQDDYWVFLSLAENLRQVKSYYTTEEQRREKPDESWRLIEELDVEQCPAMLIMPKIYNDPDDSNCTYYAFLDENGEEIDYLTARCSYSG